MSLNISSPSTEDLPPEGTPFFLDEFSGLSRNRKESRPFLFAHPRTTTRDVVGAFRDFLRSTIYRRDDQILLSVRDSPETDFEIGGGEIAFLGESPYQTGENYTLGRITFSEGQFDFVPAEVVPL